MPTSVPTHLGTSQDMSDASPTTHRLGKTAGMLPSGNPPTYCVSPQPPRALSSAPSMHSGIPMGSGMPPRPSDAGRPTPRPPHTPPSSSCHNWPSTLPICMAHYYMSPHSGRWLREGGRAMGSPQQAPSLLHASPTPSCHTQPPQSPPVHVGSPAASPCVSPPRETEKGGEGTAKLSQPCTAL